MRRKTNNLNRIELVSLHKPCFSPPPPPSPSLKCINISVTVMNMFGIISLHMYCARTWAYFLKHSWCRHVCACFGTGSWVRVCVMSMWVCFCGGWGISVGAYWCFGVGWWVHMGILGVDVCRGVYICVGCVRVHVFGCRAGLLVGSRSMRTIVFINWNELFQNCMEQLYMCWDQVQYFNDENTYSLRTFVNVNTTCHFVYIFLFPLYIFENLKMETVQTIVYAWVHDNKWFESWILNWTLKVNWDVKKGH